MNGDTNDMRRPTIVDVLLTLRQHGYRVRSIETSGDTVKVELDDLRIDQATQDTRPPPRSAHGAFAREYGLPDPDGLDDDDEGNAA